MIILPTRALSLGALFVYSAVNYVAGQGTAVIQANLAFRALIIRAAALIYNTWHILFASLITLQADAFAHIAALVLPAPHSNA